MNGPIEAFFTETREAFQFLERQYEYQYDEEFLRETQDLKIVKVIQQIRRSYEKYRRRAGHSVFP
jgi:hypothetical protein